VKAWLDRQRPSARRTWVGWGASRTTTTSRRWPGGLSREAARIQELFLAGRRDEAIAAMPDEAMYAGALVGTPARIREQWKQEAPSPPGYGVIVGADRAEGWS